MWDSFLNMKTVASLPVQKLKQLGVVFFLKKKKEKEEEQVMANHNYPLILGLKEASWKLHSTRDHNQTESQLTRHWTQNLPFFPLGSVSTLFHLVTCCG